MADNKFLLRKNPGEMEEVDAQTIITNYLSEEFPDDELLQEGKLSSTKGYVPPPVDENTIAKRNTTSQLLEIDADVSASYANYKMSKLVPGVSDDELDELLDEEFEFYLEGEEINPFSAAPPVTGLFLLPINDLKFDNGFDYHDLYIRRGPERIPDFLAQGVPPDEIVRKIFCVWFVDRGVARPIPNYKTLEVMLAARGLNYTSIGRPTIEEIKEFDMEFDGRFEGEATEDEFGNPLTPSSPIDEFVVRSMINKSYEWNERIRFRAGYEIGNPITTGRFFRDPGDYIKPVELRGKGDEIYPNRAARILDEIIVPRFQLDGRPTPEFLIQNKNILDAFELASNLVPSDPEDLYFDKAFVNTPLEEARGKLEGRLVIPRWPQPFDLDEVVNFTDNIQIDDIFFNIGYMLYGHIKQVVSLDTLKQIAEDLNVDYGSGYDSELEIDDPDGVLDEQQYEALRNQQGIINVLVERGGVTVLTGEASGLWPQFPKIAEADRLDIDEYLSYRQSIFLSGGESSIFENEVLADYEPRGSIKYYPENRYAALARQAALQLQVDQAKDTINELFPPLAARAQQFVDELNGLTGGFLDQVKRAFDTRSNSMNFLYDSYEDESSQRQWRLYKQKSSGKIKKKGAQDSFFKLFLREPQIRRDSFNRSRERAIFDDNIFHANTREGDSTADALISGYDTIQNETNLRLVDGDIKRAIEKADGGIAVKLEGDNRNGRPEGGGGARRDQQFADPYYWKATAAAFILRRYIDPNTYGNDNDMPTPPSIEFGDTNSTLIDLCTKAETGLDNLKVTIQEINQYISQRDQLLLNATTAEAILAIADEIQESKSILDSINEEVFTYLSDLESYISEKEQDYANRVFKMIQYVRKRVNDKNSKYWIEPSPSVAARFAQLNLDFGDTYKPENAYAV